MSKIPEILVIVLICGAVIWIFFSVVVQTPTRWTAVCLADGRLQVSTSRLVEDAEHAALNAASLACLQAGTRKTP